MNKRHYYKKIDYIRVLACLFVLFYHLKIMPGGFLAVCTFFTLSGYLNFVSAYQKEKFSIKEYYIKRFKKIYIPLIVVVSITVMVASLFSMTWLNLKQESISVLLGYNNFWQLAANMDYFTRHVSSPFMHFWYIAILLQLELLFPLLFVLFKKIERNIKKENLFLAMIFLTLITTGIFWYMGITQNIMIVYYHTLARFFSYFYGLFLGVVYSKYGFKISRSLKKKSNTIFIILGIIFTIMCSFISASSNYFLVSMVIVSIISCLLIRYAIIGDNSSSNNMIVKSISKLSYEIYLVQYPIIFFVEGIIHSFIIRTIVVVVFTLIVSYLLNLELTNSFKKKIYKTINILIIVLVIVGGIITIIFSKDNTKEMKMLEDKLSENLKLIKEKNKKTEKMKKEAEEELKKKLDGMENEEEKVGEIVHNLEVVGIGDSVMLGTINEFYKQFPNGYFDGEVSRSIYGAEDLINDLKNKGKLGNILILSLATNGDYSVKRNNELMEIVGDRDVYWINAVGADDPSFNDNFREYAKEHSNIHIVEWDVAAKDHPEYFYSDGIHVRENFAKYYVDCVYQTIYQDYIKEYKNKADELLKSHEEEKNKKIAFFGNELLINSYSYMQKEFNESLFYTNKNYNYKKLYKELEKGIQDNTLEHRIVLMFDDKAKLDNEEYQKIIDLCGDYEIYIVNLTKQKLSFNNKNVKVISLYKEMNKDKSNYLGDHYHLSKKGNKELANILAKKIEK